MQNDGFCGANKFTMKRYLLLCLYGCLQCLVSMGQSALPSGFDLQGHRGCRGLMPENTTAAMLHAIDLGVTTLELDVVISRDSQVVLSHEAYFHPHITTLPGGSPISSSQPPLLVYQMDYDSIRKYDVGMKPHPLFPKQQKLAAYKPLLGAVVDSCEAYARSKGKTIRYNVEIKSAAGYDGVRHPDVAVFSELVAGVLRSKKVLERSTIQSFDVRPLQYLHQKHPNIQLSYLVEGKGENLEQELAKLGFTPPIYSPYYKNLDAAKVKAAHGKGMKVLPWTVNDVPAMKALVAMGVDGIISDYPDLFAQLQ